MNFWSKLLSLPSWERGLKYNLCHNDHKQVYVAPFVGAWIEIFCNLYIEPVSMSLPSWERGLKLLSAKITSGLFLSLPSWERGLKYPQ